MDPWEHDEPMAVRRAADGRLYFAATDVTGMLRDIARAIAVHARDGDLTWTGDGRGPVSLDASTMLTVARILTTQADRMDVQLITIAGE
ncbi:hypothetical protein ACFWUZ_12285 [Streptomyces sp. NPDC058646]|uniref:hypothetical protein n=1 Tax=Streptomyces sp. NPDC058646 TaxID=3346574 RepID=UPI00364CA24E